MFTKTQSELSECQGQFWIEDEYITKEKSLRNMCESRKRWHPVQPQVGRVGGCDMPVLDFPLSSVSPPQQHTPPDGSCIMFSACSLLQDTRAPWPQHDHHDLWKLWGVTDRNTSLLHNTFWTLGGSFARDPLKYLLINKPSRFRMRQIWQMSTHTPTSIKKISNTFLKNGVFFFSRGFALESRPLV